jgi:hypothetical protein
MNSSSAAPRVFLLAVGLLAGPALAEDPPAATPPGTAPVTAATPAIIPATEPPRDRRLLNGHAFQPSDVAPPIPVSSFGLEVDFASGSATAPKYDLQGNPTGEYRTYSWVGMGQAVRFQTQFFDQLLLRGALTTGLYSGIDTKSILVVGISVPVGISLGVEWSMPVGQQVRLGASLDVNNAPQLNLLVAAAIINAIRSDQVDGAGALQIGNSLGVLPALSVAWAPRPAYGLAARVAYLASSTDTGGYGTISRQALALGLAGDVDLQKVWQVPVGLGLSYVETIPVDGTPAGIRNLSLSAMYTGKKDVAVGAVVGERVLNIRPQYDIPLKSTSPYLDVVLRIYWP